MEKEKEIERRKAPRVVVRVKVELWEDERVEEKAKGFIKDISLEGMCVVTNFSFPVGADLIFSLNLPEDLKINIYGKIIWQKEIEDLFKYGNHYKHAALLTFNEIVRQDEKIKTVTEKYHSS